MKSTLPVKSAWWAICLGLCQVPSAVAGESEQDTSSRFYFKINPAVAWIQDVSFRAAGDSGTIQFHAGPKLDLAGGYAFNQSLAMELETGVLYLRSSSTRESEFFQVHEILTQLPIMANLSYQIPIHSRFHPFLGAGVGGVYTTMDDDGDFGTTSVGHDFTFGYQGFAGARYQINPTLELGLEYKYSGTLDHNLDGFHLDPTHTHSVAFSICLHF